MKNAKVTILPAEVKSINYNNTFKQTPGEPIKLTVKPPKFVFQLNPATPTTARVIVTIDVSDEEKDLTLTMELVSVVVASTFIDNMETVIQKKYLPVIMQSVAEKVRSVTANMGININLPLPQFLYEAESDSSNPDDSLYFN